MTKEEPNNSSRGKYSEANSSKPYNIVPKETVEILEQKGLMMIFSFIVLLYLMYSKISYSKKMSSLLFVITIRISSILEQ